MVKLICILIISAGGGTIDAPGADELSDVDTAAPAPLQTLTVDIGDGVTIDLVLIPAGSFIMGSDEAKEDGTASYYYSPEWPQRHVTITQSFYMGIYPVTQEQYEHVMGENPSHFEGSRHPVERVSWEEAVEFCRRLSELTGKAVHLPTEAQWEYACRAGSTTSYYYGDEWWELDEHGWYGILQRSTHPVGEKRPNAWGLYDMHGNVWEWCTDWYGLYDENETVDPTGPDDHIVRVMRGGCWNSQHSHCRSASRSYNYPHARTSTCGFRIVVNAANE